jgi:hypothetical protein
LRNDSAGVSHSGRIGLTPTHGKNETSFSFGKGEGMTKLERSRKVFRTLSLSPVMKKLVQ